MKYISQHGYIRNTSSDTEVHADHQLRVDRYTWSDEKNIQTHVKLEIKSVLRLWSGSTDSKTLDYQRTNPREYQIVRTHTKKTTSIQDLAPTNYQ